MAMPNLVLNTIASKMNLKTLARFGTTSRQSKALARRIEYPRLVNRMNRSIAEALQYARRVYDRWDPERPLVYPGFQRKSNIHLSDRVHTWVTISHEDDYETPPSVKISISCILLSNPKIRFDVFVQNGKASIWVPIASAFPQYQELVKQVASYTEAATAEAGFSVIKVTQFYH